MVILSAQRYSEIIESSSWTVPGQWKIPSTLWICPTYPSGRRAWRQRANKSEAYPPLRKVILCSIFNVEIPPTSVETATANWKRLLAGQMREDFSLWNPTDWVARKGQLRHQSCGWIRRGGAWGIGGLDDAWLSSWTRPLNLSSGCDKSVNAAWQQGGGGAEVLFRLRIQEKR